MRLKTEQWLRALAAAFVTGLANSFLSALGISGAQAVGVDIAQLKPKQLLAMTLIGGCIGAAAYMKQSPVPPAPTGDTVPPFPVPNNQNQTDKTLTP